jgi:putative membrane protein
MMQMLGRMKKVIKYGLPVVLLVIGGIAYMTLAEEDPAGLSSEDKEFLLNAADARMMDWAEGNLAAEKGTTNKHRQYGKRMMRDQSRFMEEIKAIASAKNIVLPDKISEEKTAGLNTLKSVSGETFDRRFRRMIIKDHKRDINEFKRATESTDPEIRDFAKRHLPVLERHLQEARELNE